MESLERKSLLILGGSGFIGSHLADKAVILGYRVDVLSLKKPLPHIFNKDVNYIYLDLSNLDEVKRITNYNYDYVVNLSGYVNHTMFSQGGLKIINTHFSALLFIIEKLLKTKIKKFIQIGSSDEYGNRASPQFESMREDPISPYSFSKTASTHFLQMLNKSEGFPCVILRFFLVYGPRQNLNRFIPQVITGCLNNKEFETSLGDQIRDFCYIDDIVNAIFLSFNNDEANGKLINIASGIPIKLGSVVDLIQNIILQGKPKKGAYESKKIENPSLYAKIALSEDILSWKPSIDLASGLRTTIEYYKNQKH